ncbi:MAG TPA: lactonase family protein [Candidatus Didemnitutus sp.]|nr:lactonase family protein [Candidatus Didemnitutus sp.]
MTSTFPWRLLIGTSSSPGGTNRGIYAADFHGDGSLSAARLVTEAPNPGFLARHPIRSVVYAAGEVTRTDPKVVAGALNAYAYDAKSGVLELLNQQATGGMGVTHLSVTPDGRAAYTASYHGGQVAGFSLETDGRVGARSAWILPTGTLGPRRDRQEKPHPHCALVDPAGALVSVCDLGLDVVLTFQIAPKGATVKPAKPSSIAALPGDGPRHGRFSDDGKFLYVINELASSIRVLAKSNDTGGWSAVQSISTLPAGFQGQNICSEIQIHPSGAFVYGANRGHESIAVFRRNPSDGTLAPIEIAPCGGRHPRHFALSPDGAWLVSANRDTNNLAVLRIDPKTGQLSSPVGTTEVPSPTCVLFCATE